MDILSTGRARALTEASVKTGRQLYIHVVWVWACGGSGLDFYV